jgi:hypothetical protein
MKIIALLILVLATSFPAYADDASSLSIADFNKIGSFLVSLFYVLGVYLILASLYGMRHSSTEPQKYPFRQCVAKLITGCLLLSSAYVYTTFMVTVTGEAMSGAGSVLSSSGITDQLGDVSQSFLGKYIPAHTSRTLLGILYVIGLGAFLKGVFMLKDVGESQSNGASPFSKSLGHMFGGMICMNILKFSCFVGSFIGVSAMCI